MSISQLIVAEVQRLDRRAERALGRIPCELLPRGLPHIDLGHDWLVVVRKRLSRVTSVICRQLARVQVLLPRLQELGGAAVYSHTLEQPAEVVILVQVARVHRKVP